MKKLLTVLLTVCLLATLVIPFTSCGDDSKTVAVPSDATNRARALMLLEANGLITLREGAGINATQNDIVSNPYNLKIVEMEASSIPSVLEDVSLAIINSNYAIPAGLSPKNDSLAIEGANSPYVNVLAVKSGNENSDKIKALKAALSSTDVAEYIATQYDGNVVGVIENPGDGFDTSVNYEALANTTIKVAASPSPHCEILEIAKTILATKNITLEILPFNDYVIPNTVVENGEADANYFQHIPYLENFNETNGTHLVVALGIHVEPLGIYSDSLTSLDAIKGE